MLSQISMITHITAISWRHVDTQGSDIIKPSPRYCSAENCKPKCDCSQNVTVNSLNFAAICTHWIWAPAAAGPHRHDTGEAWLIYNGVGVTDLETGIRINRGQTWITVAARNPEEGTFTGGSWILQKKIYSKKWLSSFKLNNVLSHIKTIQKCYHLTQKKMPYYSRVF